jgi:glycerophosphoryl diester phosphodiesterase
MVVIQPTHGGIMEIWEYAMHSRFLLLLILCSLVACRKKPDFTRVSIIGHAGMGLGNQGSVYEDNSKESIELSLGLEGCQGVEMDVQLSKDNELWLFHNTELNGKTTGSGCINNQTSNELSMVHYKSIHQEKLCPLSQLNFTLFKGMKVFLDIRHHNPCSLQFIDPEKVLKALKKNTGLLQQEVELYVILSNPEWINIFKTAGFSVLVDIESVVSYYSLNSVFPNNDGLVVRNKAINTNDIVKLKSEGKKVFIFELRAAKETRMALEKFPDGIISDDLRTALIEKY